MLNHDFKPDIVIAQLALYSWQRKVMNNTSLMRVTAVNHFWGFSTSVSIAMSSDD